MAKIKTGRINSIRQQCQKIADTFAEKFEDNQDVKVGMAALTGYKIAIDAGKSQLIYKKLTGNPEKIPFFEH